jgi:hypothetical protein
MKIMTAAIALLILVVPACQSTEAPQPQQYQARRNFLSGGDAAAGRKTFFDLSAIHAMRSPASARTSALRYWLALHSARHRRSNRRTKSPDRSPLHRMACRGTRDPGKYRTAPPWATTATY